MLSSALETNVSPDPQIGFGGKSQALSVNHFLAWFVFSQFSNNRRCLFGGGSGGVLGREIERQTYRRRQTERESRKTARDRQTEKKRQTD